MANNPPTAPVSLAEALPVEQARVRELLAYYRGLPKHAGLFAAATLEEHLRFADESVAFGNVLQMLDAYERLQSCQ